MKNSRSEYAYRNRILLLLVLCIIALYSIFPLINLICSYDADPLLWVFLACLSDIFILVLARKCRDRIADKYVYKALYDDLDPDTYRKNLDPRNVLGLFEYDLAEAELYRGNYQITLNIVERYMRKSRLFAEKYNCLVRKLHVYHCLQDTANFKDTYKALERLLQSTSESMRRKCMTPQVRYFEAYANENYETCISICKNTLETWEVEGAPFKLSSVLFTYRLAVALFMAKDYVAAEKYFLEVQEMAPKLDLAKRSALYIEAIHEGTETVPSVILTADPNYQMFDKKFMLTFKILKILSYVIVIACAVLIKIFD